jgi:hypothetical protein
MAGLVLVGSRYQAIGTQALKKSEERVIRGLVPCEAQSAALGHVGHHFDRAAEICIGMPWRGEPGEVGFRQPVTLSDIPPYPRVIRHLLFERIRRAIERRRLQTEPFGNAAPHPLPAENVAIDDVERLVRRCGGLGGP